MSRTVAPSPPGRRARPHAEFMQIWEEGYVSNSVSFENMHTPSLFIVQGSPVVRADGTIDRARVRAMVAATVASLPDFRLRMRRSLLGLTPPAWVPDERFDLDRHLVFADEPVEFATADLRALSGAGDPVLSISHPLWRMRFTALAEGPLAVGLTLHHASTDGMSGMRLLSSITQSTAETPTGAAIDPFAGVRAARAWELPLLALGQWRRRARESGSLWRAYWSRPVTRRLRRVAARVLLPLRYRRGGERARAAALPPRRSAYRRIEAATAGKRARTLGGTLSDLQVSAMIAAWPGAERVVRLRFPVSFHDPAAPHIRNHVRDMEVSGDADADLAATVASVHAQVAARDAADPPSLVSGEPIGYSTLLPWVSRPRYFCGGEITEIVPFPASLGRDRLAAASIMYRGNLYVGATMPVAYDVEETTGRIAAHLTGVADTGRPGLP
ncbi:wax ester/triacylglycerol synthase domain-containing protein [Microbacterium caowuchunii]|uniref:O-acyltransferase WSD1-like N-terminal domain-containing protein n=1 Tax=Microbacterium caowuchunii TaxID=2614638 RepID=A0A5N0TE17_9MICO|nr:wax ester/triacylglycerol synthase domain-containing protein [Microbacterium caowuchunii]KAA9132921.1 hypothetical protein F6B40_10075 [Microbacterium caowuchunii]